MVEVSLLAAVRFALHTLLARTDGIGATLSLPSKIIVGVVFAIMAAAVMGMVFYRKPNAKSDPTEQSDD